MNTHLNTSKSLPDLNTQAITAATQGNWKLAIDINKKIISTNPNDTATLNRLGRAYTAMGELNQAQKTYQKVLDIDPQNSIAIKNLEKLNNLKHHIQTPSLNKTTVANQELFIKKPGVTKLVNLVNLGPSEVIASLSCGDIIKMHFSKRTISVLDHLDRHIGKLPDDMAFRFNQLSKNGHTFSACIKETSSNKIQIMIQETGHKTI